MLMRQQHSEMSMFTALQRQEHAVLRRQRGLLGANAPAAGAPPPAEGAYFARLR